MVECDWITGGRKRQGWITSSKTRESIIETSGYPTCWLFQGSFSFHGVRVFLLLLYGSTTSYSIPYFQQPRQIASVCHLLLPCFMKTLVGGENLLVNIRIIFYSLPVSCKWIKCVLTPYSSSRLLRFSFSLHAKKCSINIKVDIQYSVPCKSCILITFTG